VVTYLRVSSNGTPELLQFVFSNSHHLQKNYCDTTKPSLR